jgi:hypothetical protein
MTARTWFLLLAAITAVAPYIFGISPRTRRQWLYVVVTLAFLAWILPFMALLRSL